MKLDEVIEQQGAVADLPHVTIDEEFRKLIPPLSPMERDNLEQLIRDQGCHEPLVVWGEDDTLLDGHNRRDICVKHGLAYKVRKVELPDRQAARNWVLKNQFGRRNLGPKRLSYIRGKLYEARKAQGMRTDRVKNGVPRRAAGELAAEFRVDEKTIRRDAEFARLIDGVIEQCGYEFWSVLLGEMSKLSNADFKRLAAMERRKQKYAMERIAKTGRLPNEKKEKQAAWSVRNGPIPLPRLKNMWNRADEATRREFVADRWVAGELRKLIEQPADPSNASAS